MTARILPSPGCEGRISRRRSTAGKRKAKSHASPADLLWRRATAPTARGNPGKIDMRMIMSGAALLALAGCGQPAATPESGEAGASAQGGFATADGKGEARTGAAALTGLPEGIPPYPGADTSAAVQIAGDAAEGEGRVIAFRTTDPPPQVVAFYAGAAERAGFRIEDRRDMGPGATLTAERDNGDVLSVSANGMASGTQVQIVAGSRRSGG
jgi:hypothetical protein